MYNARLALRLGLPHVLPAGKLRRKLLPLLLQLLQLLLHKVKRNSCPAVRGISQLADEKQELIKVGIKCVLPDHLRKVRQEIPLRVKVLRLRAPRKQRLLPGILRREEIILRLPQVPLGFIRRLLHAVPPLRKLRGRPLLLADLLQNTESLPDPFGGSHELLAVRLLIDRLVELLLHLILKKCMLLKAHRGSILLHRKKLPVQVLRLARRGCLRALHFFLIGRERVLLSFDLRLLAIHLPAIVIEIALKTALSVFYVKCVVLSEQLPLLLLHAVRLLELPALARKRSGPLLRLTERLFRLRPQLFAIVQVLPCLGIVRGAAQQHSAAVLAVHARDALARIAGLPLLL